MAHALYSASGSSRWSACAASLALSQGIPPSPSSHAAFMGTAGHALAEQCLIDGTEPEDFSEVTFEDDGKTHTVKLEQEFVNGIQRYVDYVRGLPGIKFHELKVYYGETLKIPNKDAFGTADSVVYNRKRRTLYVSDLKTGRFFVDSYLNSQMLLYAAGATALLEFMGEKVDTIVMTIIQPFVHSQPAPWTVDREEFKSRLELLHHEAQRSRLAIADMAKAKGHIDDQWIEYYVRPGESQCKFCPAVTRCPAMKKLADDGMTAASDKEFDVIVKKMSPDELGATLDKLALLDIYVKAVQAEAMSRLSGGEKVTGKKLVTGRQGDRKFKDEERAKRIFKKKGWDAEVFMVPPKLKTPSQIEVALKRDEDAKDLIDRLVTRKPGAPTIADESDPRQPWTGAMQDDEFDVIS